MRNLNYQLEWIWNRRRETRHICIPLHTSEGSSPSGCLRPEDPLWVWEAPSMVVMEKEAQGGKLCYWPHRLHFSLLRSSLGDCCQLLVYCYFPSPVTEPASSAVDWRAAAPGSPGQGQLGAAEASHQVLSLPRVKTAYCGTAQNYSMEVYLMKLFKIYILSTISVPLE